MTCIKEKKGNVTGKRNQIKTGMGHRMEKEKRKKDRRRMEREQKM